MADLLRFPVLALLGLALPILGQAAIAAPATVAGGGEISGTVRSFVSGQPIAAFVTLLDANGDFVDSLVTVDGHYQYPRLAAGGYHLVATAAKVPGLAVEFWPDVICFSPGAGCKLGQLVNVGASGTATADFSLDTLGSISGRVVDAETGAPVGGGLVRAVFRSDNVWGSAEAVVGPDGHFEVLRLTPGTWKLRSAQNSGYIEQIHGGGTCEAGCDPWEVGGATIITQLNQGTTIADLELSFGPGLAGWARREGNAAAGLTVDIFDESGAEVATVATAADGRFRQVMTPGTYYLATDNGPGFVDQVFSQVPCPDGPASRGLCDPLDGDSVTVVATDPATDNLVFDLASASSLFRDSFESGDFSAWSLVFGD